jgi:hypothetical protein
VRVYVALPTAPATIVCDPLTGWAPVQAPPAVQVAAFIDDQVRVAASAVFTVVGAMLSVIAGGGTATV